jgi:hypothetical protein
MVTVSALHRKEDIMYRRRTTQVLVLALLVIAAPAAAIAAPSPTRTEPDQRCFGIQGHGETAFDSGRGAFVGEAELRVGGEMQEVSVTVRVSADGSTSFHTFEFEQGTLTTSEPIVIAPTSDPMVLSLRSRPSVVDGGTGSLHLLPGSILRLAEVAPGLILPVAASWEVRGQVCFNG